MNITESIANKLDPESKAKLLQNTPIQIYANDHLNKYQWRDSNQEETANQFENKSFDTRFEITGFITEYLKRY